MASSNEMNGVEIDNERIPTEKEINLLKAMFKKIDTDGSGTIDRSEINNLANSLGYPMSAEALSEAFHQLDEDNSGTVSFGEFVKWWTSEERETKGGVQLKLMKLKLKLLALEGKTDKVLEKVKSLKERINLDDEDHIHIDGAVNIGKDLGEDAETFISLQTGKATESVVADFREASGLSQEESSSFVTIEFPVRAGADAAEVEKLISFLNDIILYGRTELMPPTFRHDISINVKLVEDHDSKIVRLVVHSKGMLDQFLPQEALEHFFPTVAVKLAFDNMEGLGANQSPTALFETQIRSLLANFNTSFKVFLNRGVSSLYNGGDEDDQGSKVKTGLSMLTTLFTSAAIKLNFASLAQFIKFAETNFDQDGELKERLDIKIGDLIAPLYTKFWFSSLHAPADISDAVVRAGEVLSGPSRVRVLAGGMAFASLELAGVSLTNLLPPRLSDEQKEEMLDGAFSDGEIPTIASMVAEIREKIAALGVAEADYFGAEPEADDEENDPYSYDFGNKDEDAEESCGNSSEVNQDKSTE